METGRAKKPISAGRCLGFLLKEATRSILYSLWFGWGSVADNLPSTFSGSSPPNKVLVPNHLPGLSKLSSKSRMLLFRRPKLESDVVTTW